MRLKIIALMSCAAVLAPVAVAQAQNPLSSIFSCQNSNNNQGKGAVVGGLLGGLLGNQINDNDRTTGTVLGAALGAAAGSYVGCNMTNADTSRAETATRQALNENRSTNWSGQNGTSGRIDIIDTFQQNAVSDRVGDPYYEDRNRSSRPASLADVRFAPGVQQPPRNYGMANGRYETRNRVNIRSAPSSKGRVLGQMRSGEEFDALARVGGGWLLAGQRGEAIGYISEDVVNPAGFDDTYVVNRGNGVNDRNASGQVCRVFDQTIQRRNAVPTTQRFTACQAVRSGEWVLQS